ncbi:hypothetical protein KKG24_00440 [Patescibacteria group bacterium]|nr:hypothetical protein [Patescibacteria group bacterium]
MPGIKAINSKNLTIRDCKFSGFETDIELENVEGFLSENNEFSRENDPRILLPKIIKGIKGSGLDRSSQKRLYGDMINFLLLGKNGGDRKKEIIKNRILKAVGSKIADYFVQLAAAVSVGLIIKN